MLANLDQVILLAPGYFAARRRGRPRLSLDAIAHGRPFLVRFSSLPRARMARHLAFCLSTQSYEPAGTEVVQKVYALLGLIWKLNLKIEPCFNLNRFVSRQNFYSNSQYFTTRPVNVPIFNLTLVSVTQQGRQLQRA